MHSILSPMICEEAEGRKIGSGRSEESLQRFGATQLGWGSEALMATTGLLPGPSCPSPHKVVTPVRDTIPRPASLLQDYHSMLLLVRLGQKASGLCLVVLASL